MSQAPATYLEPLVPHPAARGELVLSLFPGIDLFGRAFEEAGFTVVRGPDPLWGGDIATFHPPAYAFAGIIGGPPCQRHSMAARISASRWPGRPKAACLIAHFRRVVSEARPRWYLMENVANAPAAAVVGYHEHRVVVNCRHFGVPQKRRRRAFCFGSQLAIATFAPRPAASYPTEEEAGYSALASEGGRGRSLTLRHMPQRRPWATFCALQGLPEGYELPGFTIHGKYRAVGNGVPLPAGRAMALAVLEAVYNGAAHE